MGVRKKNRKYVNGQRVSLGGHKNVLELEW